MCPNQNHAMSEPTKSTTANPSPLATLAKLGLKTVPKSQAQAEESAVPAESEMPTLEEAVEEQSVEEDKIHPWELYADENCLTLPAQEAVRLITRPRSVDDLLVAKGFIDRLALIRFGRTLSVLVLFLALCCLPSCVAVDGGSISYDAATGRWTGAASVKADWLKLNPDGSISFGPAGKSSKPLGTK